MDDPEGMQEQYRRYLDDNFLRFGSIIEFAGELPERASSLISVVHEPGIADIHITKGLLEASDVRALFQHGSVEIPVLEADHLANIYNDSKLAEAELDITELLKFAQKIINRNLSGSGYSESIDETGLPSYTRATRQVIHLDPDTMVTICVAEGIEGIGTVAHYELQSSDEQLTNKTHLYTLNNNVKIVLNDISPRDNDAQERWAVVLGAKMTELFDVIAGGFDDESELDAALFSVLAPYLETEHEAEVSTVLHEIRAFALASKASAQFISNYLPSTELLDKWVGILENA